MICTLNAELNGKESVLKLTFRSHYSTSGGKAAICRIFFLFGAAQVHREKPMKSIKEIYRIGRGPSSSHTMGPESAAKLFISEFPGASRYEAVLYGSLAKTGIGHGTDRVLRETFAPRRLEIKLDMQTTDIPHPNTLDFTAYDAQGNELGRRRVCSVGGGAINVEGRQDAEPPEVYPFKNFAEIKEFCDKENIRIPDLVERYEGSGIWHYLDHVWNVMNDCIKRGLKTDGKLPGGLGIMRKASVLYNRRHMDESPETRENRLVCAYAYAVSEENASCGEIVTAPTCGACGVLPAVLRYTADRRGFSENEILRAIATAGVIGNVIKTNASISGAECGCQAEIGSACSMAAAALGELYGMDIDQIEYAAEVAMEHHLGLTCDPVMGLVQVPCIERNAVAAMRAINAVSLANFLTYTRKISFDLIVETMYQTGKDLSKIYRETSEGGLAKLYKPANNEEEN